MRHSGANGPIRIAHIITNLGTGGAEVSLERLVRALPRERYQSHVYSLMTLGDVGPRLRAAGIPVTALGMTHSPVAVFAGLARLRQHLKQLQPELIQGWMYHGNAAATLVSGAAPGAPLLWNVRAALNGAGTQSWWTRLLVRGTRWLAHKPARFLNNSWESAEAHARVGYSLARTVIIPNGFDTQRFRPAPEQRAHLRAELGLDAATPLVAVIGRNHPVKGFPVFVEAMLRVMHTHSAVHALVLGPGCEREAQLRAMVATAGLEQRFHFCAARPSVEAVLAGLDIYCQSSLSEGFPNALAEAMSCAVPCVGTAVGDTSRVLGNCGVLVPPRDAAALARGIESLLVMPAAQRLELGARSRERICREFSLSSLLRQYERCYEECLSTGTQVQLCR